MSTQNDVDVASDNTAGTALVFPAINCTAGDLLWVVAGHEGAPGSESVTWDQTVTNTGSLTVLDHVNGDMSAGIFYARATVTGTVVATYNTSLRPFRAGTVGSETPAASKQLVFDQAAAGGQGTSTAASAGSVSPTGAGFAVSGGKIYGSLDGTASSGWTKLVSSFVAYYAQSRRPTDSTSITGSWTISSAEAWLALMAVFQEIDSGGGGGSPNAVAWLRA